MVISLIINVLSIYVCVKSANNINKNLMLGKVIFVDPGHGGKDNGAISGNVLEDEINLKISGYLMELLIDSNAHVLVSRTGDYDLASIYDKNRKREDLKKRVQYINDSKPDMFVSIHLNTYTSNNVKGAQTFYQNNEESKKMANYIQIQLNNLESYARKSKYGDYYLLNKTYVSGVLIECGFLSNEEEKNQLISESYQRKIAQKIYLGIINYFNDIY